MKDAVLEAIIVAAAIVFVGTYIGDRLGNIRVILNIEAPNEAPSGKAM